MNAESTDGQALKSTVKIYHPQIFHIREKKKNSLNHKGT